MYTEELPESIQNELLVLSEITNNELEFVKSQRWINDPDRGARIRKYKLHVNFTNNAVENATRFYNIAKDYMHNNDVKDLFLVFLEFVGILSKSFEDYKKIQIWTKYNSDTDEELAAIEAEATFQSDILNKVQEFKNKVRKIDISDSNSKLNKISLPIFQDTPLSIVFMDQVFERYPITKEATERKLATLERKEDETPKNSVRRKKVSGRNSK